MPIQKLPQLLVNQIAAGEVIERPASVVKELVENSLDAGATQIDIVIEEGGSQLIRVSDNGSGIPSDELLLAVAPHATSKLGTPDDLASIKTLGFRGEAIASIASVSRLRLTSRAVVGEQVAEAGGLIEVVGGDGGAVEPVGTAPGSVVEVRDLFFNTPARRKFLRSASAEFGHIADVVDRIAMSHHRIGFTLSHQGRKVSELVATDSRKRRCIDLLGQDIEEALLEFESDPVFRRPGMGPMATEAADEPMVWGLAGLPSIAKSSSKFQFICVNGRPIRDRSLSHAVKEAYRGLIEPNKQPVAVVFLEVPHDAVDVNVHPAKAEVRFRDPSRIHGLVLTCIRRRLLGADLTPKVLVPAFGGQGTTMLTGESIGSEQPQGISAGGNEAGGSAALAWSPEAFVDYFKRMAPQQRGMVFEQVKREMTHESPDAAETSSISETNLIGGSNDQLPIQNALPINSILQVHKSYLVTQDEQGILIIDQHALHERVMFEELRQRVLGSDQPLESQRLLMPGIIKANPRRLALVEELKPLLDRIGIEVEQMSQSALGIQAFPTFLFDRKVDPVEFVDELFDQAEEGRFALSGIAQESSSAGKDCQSLVNEAVLHKVLDMMACKAAVKAGDALSSQELTALLEQRSQVERASNCPHGRPTAIRLTLHDLEKQFKRT